MTSPARVRFFVLGLPIGLALSLVVAGFIYVEKEKRKRQDVHYVASRRAVSSADLQRYVTTLSSTIGPRHTGAPDALRAAAKMIESTLGPANFGYKPSRQSYKVGHVDCHNIILEITGTDRPDEIFIVGAHYDSVPTTPGADDNASGVAALMALAQAMGGSKPERTLRFVFFVNEEPPHFQTDAMGSLVYAKACQKLKENIIGMISLDCLGYFSDAPNSQRAPAGLPGAIPSEGNFLALVGNATSTPLVDSIADHFKKNTTLPIIAAALPVSVPEAAWSDHWSFWQCGYQAVILSDTGGLRNPHYHIASDTAATLDYEKLTRTVETLETYLRTTVVAR
jgi:hypothetical protein